MATLSGSLMVADEPAPSGLVRAAGRGPEDVAFDNAMVGFFVEAAGLLGVPKSVAAIYGICFASSEPLSFADFEARLDISMGSISQGLRVLREIGALQPVAKSDDRRERYEPDLALRKLVERWLDTRLKKQLVAGQGRLEQLNKTVPGGRSASAKVLRGRLKALQTWHSQSRALLPVVKTFLKIT